MHIVNLKPKILVGVSDEMSLAEDGTMALWQKFMPNKKLLTNTMGTEVYNVHIYPHDVSFFNFTENTVFTKWACTEVSSADSIPEGFELLLLEGGTYLVEEHNGPANEVQKTYERIFTEILPHANFSIDQRPHFEVLGDKYLGMHPNSKEDIWIPIAFDAASY